MADGRHANETGENMNSDVEPKLVGATHNNRRVLIRRGLIGALVFVCITIAYSFFVVIQFHTTIVAFQKQKAYLIVTYQNDRGEPVETVYGGAKEPLFIPGPLLRYHRSLSGIELYRQTITSPEELDELFDLLSHFPRLNYLGLEGFHINQERAIKISQLRNLKTIGLKKCKIEKSCLESLLNIDGLTFVGLPDSEFSESELETLTRGPTKETLTGLNLSYCDISDRGASMISRLRNLESLELDGTQITDQGLKILARLPRLKVLVLDHTGVTDYGVGYLSSTPNLVELSLSNTSASDAMLETLKREIPALRVSDD
ncbi:MAG: hypothetical protein P1V19_14320 [Gimesia sp.]|nr:hypothetical protein [Gimesia sp.]